MKYLLPKSVFGLRRDKSVSLFLRSIDIITFIIQSTRCSLAGIAEKGAGVHDHPLPLTFSVDNKKLPDKIQPACVELPTCSPAHLPPHFKTGCAVPVLDLVLWLFRILYIKTDFR
jgi:hypothetical protein